ncbi:MAG: hypothetical protein Q6K35_09660 [Thermostichus sp. DG02_4_bins_136]
MEALSSPAEFISNRRNLLTAEALAGTGYSNIGLPQSIPNPPSSSLLHPYFILNLRQLRTQLNLERKRPILAFGRYSRWRALPSQQMTLVVADADKPERARARL